MGFRFRKSVKLFPGIRINLSKSGASLSVGGKGLTTNFSKRGVTTTVGIPGSGISFTSTTAPAKTQTYKSMQISPIQANAQLENSSYPIIFRPLIQAKIPLIHVVVPTVATEVNPLACPVCRYERKSHDAAPLTQCPQCALVFARYESLKADRSEKLAKGNGKSWMKLIVSTLLLLVFISLLVLSLR